MVGARVIWEVLVVEMVGVGGGLGVVVVFIFGYDGRCWILFYCCMVWYVFSEVRRRCFFGIVLVLLKVIFFFWFEQKFLRIFHHVSEYISILARNIYWSFGPLSVSRFIIFKLSNHGQRLRLLTYLLVISIQLIKQHNSIISIFIKFFNPLLLITIEVL